MYDPLLTITINWLDTVHIGFMELFNHYKFLVFKIILNFVVTLRMILQQDQITLQGGHFFSTHPHSTLLCTFLYAFQYMLIHGLH